ncbi:hypothetical protein VHEMI01933 [[Torrubiella] hemipterigena]|uniref:Uncharacterized protein n=1 Tax=[Torrubiella] hemipterigena TaxID=1531966 RepID=A0A0A1SN72_9HYPO|nr:hypothetical protein VHEMI01933 [[Torrubiella] hemipterigena]
MFCLRSWLPLLFIPTNASPAFIFIFFLCTYFLHRPCVYCSVLLLILFFTSCNWADRCFFDLSSNWFLPRSSPSTEALESSLYNSTLIEMFNTTMKAATGAATDRIGATASEWTGLGLEWLRSALGKREWRIECMDVYIKL